MDMELEEWSLFERKLVGRHDRVSRLGHEWEFGMFQLTVLIPHYGERAKTFALNLII